MPHVAPFTQIVLVGLFAICVMAWLWAVQKVRGNAGIVDLGWSSVIGIGGVFIAVTADGEIARRALAAGFIALWSFRLSIYLFQRMHGAGEENRYAALRTRWGAKANLWLFYFFQVQAIAALLFLLPLLVSCSNTRTFSTLDFVGLIIWLVGFSGIVIADYQLNAFKQIASNRGKTCRRGLWRYSRHPNYFFEWIMWWCWLPLAIGTSYWWIALIVPLLLLYLLLFKTGIPPAEAQAIASRGDDYRMYQRVTSPFIPWCPKKDTEP